VGTKAGVDRQPPGKHTLKILLVPIVALVIISNIGDALAPQLVNSHPLQLIAMNARNRNLILVTNQLDALSYYLVGTLRLLLSDPLFFLIGFWYGDAALTWMDRRSPTYGKHVRQWERWFSKASYPLVFLMPNNFICLFAGAAGMGVGPFFALNVSGTVVRLYLIRWLGEAFEKPIDWVLDFIQEYRIPLLIVSLSFFGYAMVKEIRQSRRDIDELADVLDESVHPHGDPKDAAQE
jgi:membrane protein DedA with SNARE-associated domain